MKFQIGDRVILISEYADYDACCNEDLPRGSTGTVCEIANDGKRIGVSWDNFTDGHDCDGSIADSAPNSGYYVEAWEVEVIEQVAENVFFDLDSLL